MKLKQRLGTAALTGVFCAGFAGIINVTTDMLSPSNVMLFGAISGFLGSLFANLVLRRGN